MRRGLIISCLKNVQFSGNGRLSPHRNTLQKFVKIKIVVVEIAWSWDASWQFLFMTPQIQANYGLLKICPPRENYCRQYSMLSVLARLLDDFSDRCLRLRLWTRLVGRRSNEPTSLALGHFLLLTLFSVYAMLGEPSIDFSCSCWSIYPFRFENKVAQDV